MMYIPPKSLLNQGRLGSYAHRKPLIMLQDTPDSTKCRIRNGFVK